LKTKALRFRVNGKHFETRAFRKRWSQDDAISLLEFPITQFQNDRVFFALFKFLRWSVLRKHLMRFRSETLVWTRRYCHLNGA